MPKPIAPLIPWAPDEDLMIKRMHKKGHTMTDIMDRLNKTFKTFRTRSSVAGRIHRGHAVSKKELRGQKIYCKKTKKSKVIPAEVIYNPDTVKDLIDLNDNHCRWPYGDSPFKFCGAERAEDHKAYCPYHALKSRRNQPKSQ